MEIQKRPYSARVHPGALKMARKFNRFSQRELADRAKVSHQIVSFLETGKRKTCNPETASKLAEALNMPTQDIFLLEPLHVTETGLQKVAA